MSTFTFPPGIAFEDVKGCGTSGMAALVPNTNLVLKFPLGDEDECARCDLEKKVYEHLKSSSSHSDSDSHSHSRPTSLLGFRGSTEHGILLDYAENGPVRQYLRGSKSPGSVPLLVLLRWAGQAAEALEFMHAEGISHGDVSCTNFFLDASLDLKVGDFTNSSFEVSAQDLNEDISQFGSALYEMAIGHMPYQDLTEEEREMKLQQNDFPKLEDTGISHLILRCWTGQYTSFADILDDIKITGQRYSQKSAAAKVFAFGLLVHLAKALVNQ